ncbi:MAG: hypothetical protein H0T62_02230 [Parachlamydiaceae bacterium]|nr:hypothetical protein [Parachlamydiaceae bacterium]
MQFNPASSCNTLSTSSTSANIEPKKRERAEENQTQDPIKKNRTEGEFSDNKVEEIAQAALSENSFGTKSYGKSILDSYNVSNFKPSWQEDLSTALQNKDWNKIGTFLDNHFILKKIFDASVFNNSSESSFEEEDDFEIDINLPFTEGPFKGFTLFYSLVF